MSNIVASGADHILLSDVCSLIQQSKSRIFRTVHSELVMLHWHIGERIQTDILKSNRAEYGHFIIDNLSDQLTRQFGRGYSKSALSRMVSFYNLFQDAQTVATLSQQLSWSHFVELIALDSPTKIEFYSELCRLERWSVRDLRSKIQGMFFERTALSKKPEQIILQEVQMIRETDTLPTSVIFQDPYLLDFLELEDTYSEKDLEQAILRELEKFLLELGTDFTFVARQKRITIGPDDYYLDLLLFHRGLRRLVVIELKIGKFQASDKGQMELYLRWLDKFERKSGEETPLGIILCAEKNNEQVELLELYQSGIHVAEYMTQLPSEDLLKERLQKAISKAKERVIQEKF